MTAFAAAILAGVVIVPAQALAQNVQACRPGRYVKRTALPIDHRIAGTYTVAIPGSFTDRVDSVSGIETFTASAGAAAGVLQIQDTGYIWTDSDGHAVKGLYRLFEPGTCQTGNAMAHVVVEGGTLDDTVYVVSTDSGIALYNPNTGYLVYEAHKR